MFVEWVASGRQVRKEAASGLKSMGWGAESPVANNGEHEMSMRVEASHSCNDAPEKANTKRIFLGAGWDGAGEPTEEPRSTRGYTQHGKVATRSACLLKIGQRTF